MRKPSALGKRIAKLRKVAGVSARELSIFIGASQGVVGQLERGQVQGLRGDLLVAVAKALGTTAEHLLTGEGETPNSGEVQAAAAALKQAKSASKAA